MRVLESKIYRKYTIKNFQTEGRAPGAPALDPPLERQYDGDGTMTR